MHIKILKEPVHARIAVPFVIHRNIISHEVQLLSRVPEHKRKEKPQVRKLLPGIAGHLIKKRPFPVHHLIVRNRQHKVFAECIPQRKSYQVMMVLPVNGVLRKVSQYIVHPAHIPFHVKPQPA